MAEFGWANVKGGLAKGAQGSVQYNDGTGELSGSSKLVYDEGNDTLTLSGSLQVSGSIYANELVVDVTNRNVVNISATGSTTFGDTTDDTHTMVGKTILTGAAGSNLIYELSTTGYNSLAASSQGLVTVAGGKYYLSSSNSQQRGILNITDIFEQVTFDRVEGAALVVSGAAVFNDPVSIQGGIYGASPINVFAPLKFSREDLADDVAPESELTIQDGKFVGSVVISSSYDNHGLFLQGAGRIVMSTLTGSDGTSTSPTTEPAPEIIMSNKNALPFSNAALDMRNMQDVPANEHIVFLNRRHTNSRYRTGQIQFRAEIPVLTGSNSSSASDYQLSNYDSVHLIADTDLRRHSTLFRIGTLESNVDKDYKFHSVYSSSLTNESGSKYPIIHPSSSLYDGDNDNYAADVFNTLLVGSWANPGQDNRYGVNRGIGVYGSIYPFPINLTSVSGGNFDAKDMTLGHPNTRWGDMYIHDERYIRWGQKADGYANYYKTNALTASARNESGSVMLGYSTSSYRLEVTGAALYMKDGGALGAGTYLNFGGVSGSDGYGIRDNSGTVQFKNSTGDWEDMGSGTGDSTIGAAEDGDYTDGLYTDFTTLTLVGTAVDRFNEVLKILAPSPAPSVRSIDHDQSTGVSAKLSFDASNIITGYTASSTNAGFDAVTRNNSYTAATSGSNIRLGVYNAQEITGNVNDNVGPSINNSNITFTSGAFGNGNTGTLKLELNGTVIHSVNLASFTGAGQPATGSATSLTNGSGFVDVSIASSSLDGNGAEWYIFKYRTAKYKIEADDQKNGWNYLRVIHSVGSTDNASNYIEWINDPTGAGQALAVVNPRIDSVTLTGSKYVSGVQYNTGLTASYKAHITNMYRNVYPSNSNTITFNPSNANAISAQSVPAISSGDETNIVPITASVVYDSNFLLNGTISTSLNATHPLKANLSSTGSASITGMLIDARSDANSNLSETFEDEDFRITSGSYANQAAVTDGAATWNSQNHMTSSGAAGHEDGLLFYNRRLYSPKSTALPNNGNFSTLANVESGQPNYSGVTGYRTFYRKIQNTSGSPVNDLKISMNKNTSVVRESPIADNNDIDIHIKLPGQTGFLHTGKSFVYGSVDDGDGALISGADDNANIQSAGTVQGVHCITFGTASLANNDYVVLKITARADWTGYIDDMTFQLGASDVSAPTEAPVLDDVDVNDIGTTTKLSFGSSNAVSGYAVVNGSSIGSSDVDTNGVFQFDSADLRGVFSNRGTIDGELNEDVGSNGDNYPANAFRNAYTGSLILEVNGSEIHELQLGTTLDATASSNASGSQISVSAVGFSTTTDSIPDYTKPYRTGTYQVAATNQVIGWNYMRIIHRYDGSDQVTNYVQWVVDNDSNALASSSVAISNFNHPSVYYQSGIGYFASRPSGSYTYNASNVYRNVYSNSSTALQFPTTTNSSISNIRISGSGISTFNSAVSSTGLPNLNNTTNCEQQDIQVTGTVLFDSLTSISGGLGLFTKYGVTVDSSIAHPLKSNLSTTSLSKNAFMVYSGSIGSTNLNTQEYFNTEDYRIVSGNYVSQSNATSSANSWNPQTHMNAANAHGDGMVTVNGYAISPLKIGNVGDTRNVADSGDLQAPSGNPDYSTLSDDVRTYYRYFQNNSGLAKATFTVTLYGDANLISKSGAFYTGTLGANKNIQVELKVPFDPAFTGLDDTSTAWADCVKPYGVGTQPDTNGVGIFNGGGSDLNQTVGGGGRAIALQLQGKQVRSNQYFVVKISAHKDWTGYLSRIAITY
jgi:hypothetical protein